MPASTTSFFALGVGSLLIIPVAVVTAPRELPGVRAALAVVALGMLCTALAYMLYYSLIDQVGGERAALANYLTPAFALFYGMLLLGEPIRASAIIGLVLIIAGGEITCEGPVIGVPGAMRELATMCIRLSAKTHQAGAVHGPQVVIGSIRTRPVLSFGPLNLPSFR